MRGLGRQGRDARRSSGRIPERFAQLFDMDADAERRHSKIAREKVRRASMAKIDLSQCTRPACGQYAQRVKRGEALMSEESYVFLCIERL